MDHTTPPSWHILLTPLTLDTDVNLETAAPCPAATYPLRVFRSVFPGVTRSDLYAYVDGLPDEDMVIITDRPGMVWTGSLETLWARLVDDRLTDVVVMASVPWTAAVQRSMHCLALHLDHGTAAGASSSSATPQCPWTLCYWGKAAHVRRLWRRLGAFLVAPPRRVAGEDSGEQDGPRPPAPRPTTVIEEALAWHRFLTVYRLSSALHVHVDYQSRWWDVRSDPLLQSLAARPADEDPAEEATEAPHVLQDPEDEAFQPRAFLTVFPLAGFVPWQVGASATSSGGFSWPRIAVLVLLGVILLVMSNYSPDEDTGDDAAAAVASEDALTGSSGHDEGHHGSHSSTTTTAEASVLTSTPHWGMAASATSEAH